MEKWNGKLKAVTFSFDDGVTQDLPLIAMLDRFGLKATFNLNSGAMGIRESKMFEGHMVYRDIVFEHDIAEVYKNHEIASHTSTHPNLVNCTEEEIVRQVEEDRARLSSLAGYEVRGFAYPCCMVDGRVIETVRTKTGAAFGRTVLVTGKFDPPKDLFHLDFTCRSSGEDLIRLAKEFVSLKTDRPQIFSVWGHTYEFDIHRDWHIFEEFCKIISGKDDIFYGTNSEVFL